MTSITISITTRYRHSVSRLRLQTLCLQFSTQPWHYPGRHFSRRATGLTTPISSPSIGLKMTTVGTTSDALAASAVPINQFGFHARVAQNRCGQRTQRCEQIRLQHDVISCNTQLALGGGTMTVAPVDMVRRPAVCSPTADTWLNAHIVDRLLDQKGNVLFARNPATVCKGLPKGNEPTEKKTRSRIKRKHRPVDPRQWLQASVLDQLVEQKEARCVLIPKLRC